MPCYKVKCADCSGVLEIYCAGRDDPVAEINGVLAMKAWWRKFFAKVLK